MPLADEFFGEIGNHAFGSAIEFRRHAFNERRDDCDTHGLVLLSEKQVAVSIGVPWSDAPKGGFERVIKASGKSRLHGAGDKPSDALRRKSATETSAAETVVCPPTPGREMLAWIEHPIRGGSVKRSKYKQLGVARRPSWRGHGTCWKPLEARAPDRTQSKYHRHHREKESCPDLRTTRAVGERWNEHRLPAGLNPANEFLFLRPRAAEATMNARRSVTKGAGTTGIACPSGEPAHARPGRI